jgi:hypothetical protein
MSRCRRRSERSWTEVLWPRARLRSRRSPARRQQSNFATCSNTRSIRTYSRWPPLRPRKVTLQRAAQASRSRSSPADGSTTRSTASRRAEMPGRDRVRRGRRSRLVRIQAGLAVERDREPHHRCRHASTACAVGQRVKMVVRGLALVAADGGIAARQVVGTSNTVAGRVQSASAPPANAALGRAIESTGGTVANFVIVAGDVG